MKTYRIATIPGDGIGKEVVPAGREVLEALHRRIDAGTCTFVRVLRSTRLRDDAM